MPSFCHTFNGTSVVLVYIYAGVNTSNVDVKSVVNDRCTTVTSTCTDESAILLDSLTEYQLMIMRPITIVKR